MASRVIDILSDNICLGIGSTVPAFSVIAYDRTNRGNGIVMPTTPTNFIAGVSKALPDANGYVAIGKLGQFKCLSDGTAVINPGDYVVCSTTTAGRVVTQAIAAGDANLYNIVGRCCDSGQIPATAGAIVTVELKMISIPAV